ncbi:cryptochrome/photolyase family protein [Thioflexithrix psekupsensis]|uniref:Deoxyribodipyrimidine photolyase n=1 Tax=Thioflexithrix psekupsensis TaxID=1570016 RepID=A0A251X4P0_9GAMM|nr:deoxyribodipyrimidine photo-lyase [Thioflexithrix psekupsensis]OUD11679.1 deoxyribodipyrimidine photolyase [Thioflexithrix psekupsensis]
MNIALIWFRRDLRLHDNPALSYAVQQGYHLLPVYLYAPEEELPWSPGAASRWWLHHSLFELRKQLQQQQLPLLLFKTQNSLQTLQQLITHTGAKAVFWNRCYEPILQKRDEQIKQQLRQLGLEVRSFNGFLLHEPWTVQTQQHTPFKVFTPYWNACQKQTISITPLPKISDISTACAPSETFSFPNTCDLAELDLLPRVNWTEGLAATWAIGEVAALAQLQRLCQDKLADYQARRDFPGSDGVSRLSPYLHFGELSVRQVYYEVQRTMANNPECRKGGESLLRQLYWREFAWHLLYHFPYTSEYPLYDKFSALFSCKTDKDQLTAWQTGHTGYPIVDAGMRELWHTGWMHNRVRMLVASLLTKNMGISWLEGAKWFWDTLVDADLANNTLGWQWVAGCGADAAPYYRFFNPQTQSEKFDPQANYIRRWLPEFAHLDERACHNPTALQRIPLNYPAPIVDYKSSRETALAAYGRLKQESSRQK